MAAKFLEVAVILTAMDKMSSVITGATSRAQAGFTALANSKERADKSLSDGLAMGAAGAAGIAVLNHFANAYGNVQEAQLGLRAAMMGPGGLMDENLMKHINQFSISMSKQFAGSQMDYIEMVRVMKQNKLNPEDILGGTGKAISRLSELFKMPPASIGLFASRMRNDMRVPNNEMEKMVDLMARLNGAGVGTTGAETVEKLTELFSKAGLGASNLHLFGEKAASDIGSLGGMFLSKGLDAASVGTTFRRIFDNIADPKKLTKMNAEAAIFHKHLTFFDEHGKFKGIDNFIGQLSTLQNLTDQQRAAILDPFGSKQGLGGDVMKNLANYGLQDYIEYKKRLSDQGTLIQKVSEIQKGLNQQERIAGSNIDNLSSAIGKSYNPAVTEAVKITGWLADVMGTFIGNHQWVAATIGGALGLASAGMAIGAAFRFIGTAWTYSGMGRLIASLSEIGGISLSLGNWGGFISGAGMAALDVIAPLAALVLVLTHLNEVGEDIKNNFAGFKKAISGIGDAISDDWNWLTKGEVKHRHTSAPKGAVNWASINQEMDAKKKADAEGVNKRGYSVSNLPVVPVTYSPTYHINAIDSDHLKGILQQHTESVKKTLFSGHNFKDPRTSY